MTSQGSDQLERLLEAPVDPAWIAEVGSLSQTSPADGFEAILRARVFSRLERVMSGWKLAACATMDSLDPTCAWWGDKNLSCGDLEVGIALDLPPRTGGQVLSDALALESLPVTKLLLGQGRISQWHFSKVVEALWRLGSDSDRRACEMLIWRRAGYLDADGNDAGGGTGRTVSDVMRFARRVITACDPDAFNDDHKTRRRESDVRVRHDDAAMSWITVNLPTVDAQIVMTAVNAHAIAAKLAGDERPLGELRAEAVRVFAEAYPTGHSMVPAAGSPAESNLPVPRGHGRPVEVQIAITLDALRGLNDNPGEIPSVGPIPADVVRALVNEAAARLIVCDNNTGKLLDYGTTTYRAPAHLAAFVTAEYPTSVAPGSQVPAQRCDLDHISSYDPGPTSVTNLAPLDRRSHVLKTHSNLAYQRDEKTGVIIWTTPLGQTKHVEPFDYRLGP